MNLIRLLQGRLSAHPGVRAEIDASSISVPATDPDGFRVTLVAHDDEYQVAFEGWHEHFDSADEATRCFLFGLSERCRLKVVSRGSFDYKWTVEALYDDQWVEDSVTGLFMFPFWRRPRVRYLRNHLDL